ncbi:MAG TPA: acetamidase/formamidase family protein [Chloroflexia bacterium]|nr:acetamidase/formamidase family protein [Chloroflexia bacterium]
MATHQLAAEDLHYCWDNSIPPRLEIESGDTVFFETRDASDGYVQPGMSIEEYSSRKSKGHPLTGPVYIKGAQPGDVLEVEVLEVNTANFGWTGFRPGVGLLPDDFGKPFFHIWNLKQSGESDNWAEFKENIRLPLAPFCGVMGLALKEPGVFSTTPPRSVGGNMDIRQLTAGSKVWLPVQVAGGLFSIGDCHAAQGDGEVCVTAIETNGEAAIRFNLLRGKSIKEPCFWTSASISSQLEQKGYFATSSHSPDLFLASQQAIRYMLEYLVDNYHLSAEEAYILCSVAVDLKISQIVDGPNYTVSAFLPNAIFSK